MPLWIFKWHTKVCTLESWLWRVGRRRPDGRERLGVLDARRGGRAAKKSQDRALLEEGRAGIDWLKG